MVLKSGLFGQQKVTAFADSYRLTIVFIDNQIVVQKVGKRRRIGDSEEFPQRETHSANHLAPKMEIKSLCLNV